MQVGGAIKHVAVVKDDETVVELVGELLEERGWNCIPQFKGTNALEQINRDQPDLAIRDIRKDVHVSNESRAPHGGVSTQ